MSNFRALLQSFLSRRIPPREAIRGLAEFATADFESNPAYVRYRETCPDQIELTPAAVRDALEAYLAKEMTDRELRDWALFVTLTSAFTTPDPPAHDEDWFDPMWDTVHDLACPEVHGAITPASVRGQLEALSRYNHGAV